MQLAARVEGNEADIAILGEELARLRAQVDAGAFGRGGKRLVAYGDDRMPSSGRDISALLYVAPVLLGIVPVGWILSQVCVCVCACVCVRVCVRVLMSVDVLVVGSYD